MSAYYNENDPKAAAWLRELISAGLIAKGDVDERSIVDVRGSDLAGYTQCHFFAGIGGWSFALRLAGWPDHEPVWTGSCPCQPFSAAGKQAGEKDTRHLWPDFWRLISESAPHVVFGEQVASSIGFGWIDGVRADLETKAYALGVAVLGSHSVGAPHIRQRLYWVAQPEHAIGRPEHKEHSEAHRGNGFGGRREPFRLGDSDIAGPQGRRIDAGEYTDKCATRPAGSTSGMGHAMHAERRPLDGPGKDELNRDDARRPQTHGEPGTSSEVCGLAVSNGRDGSNGHVQRSRQHGQQPADGGSRFWSDFDIVHCTDNKARRIEPGTFPLAHGIPARVGRLRGYGNAITPEVAAEFIAAYLESL